MANVRLLRAKGQREPTTYEIRLTLTNAATNVARVVVIRRELTAAEALQLIDLIVAQGEVEP